VVGIEELCEQRNWQFFMGYHFAIFNYAAQALGGFIDVSSFDLEGGLFAQGDRNQNPNNPTQTSAFVTAVTKNNGTTEFAIKGGDATSGKLSTYYKGKLPDGYSPMKKQGAIVLGSGGDCCLTNTNQSEGTFYEGCIVSGYPSDATEDAVQANVVAAQYGK
jgi:hypothetical protein